MATRVWMVRAGNDNVLVDKLKDNNAVAVGWAAVGNLSALTDRAAFRSTYRERVPEDSEKRAQVNADQLYRFVREIKVGDVVMSYIKSTRMVMIGNAWVNTNTTRNHSVKTTHIYVT